MSSRMDSCPLQRGGIDTEGGLTTFLGKVFVLPDVPISTSNSATSPRTSHNVKVRVVRNSASFALRPGRAVTFKAGTNMTEVDGYATTTGQEVAGIVDERIAAAGVASGDDFLIVVEGPSLVLNDIASGATTVIAEGDYLCALTAVTSGATTAGRLLKQDLTGATALLGAQIQMVIGRALSAATTANTATNVLAFIKSRFC